MTLLRIKRLKQNGKTRISSRTATNRKSIGYEVVQEKVFGKSSKGRQQNFKRASIASQSGVFSKPEEHISTLGRMKVVYKYRLVQG